MARTTTLTIAALTAAGLAATPAAAQPPAGIGGGTLRQYISTDNKAALAVWVKGSKAHILAADFVPPRTIGPDAGYGFCFTGKTAGKGKYRGKSIGTHTDAPFATKAVLRLRGGKRMTLINEHGYKTYWRRATNTAIVNRGAETGSSYFSIREEMPYLTC